LLRADGTLDLHAGFSGSLDPRGWRMVSQPGQPPRFVPAGDAEAGVRASAPRASAAPGDEFWDDRFDVLGVSGYVYALAVSGEDVYVGGLFSAVDGLSVNNIARWNSATGTWSALGEGVAGYVYAIAVSGSDVYVGGLFNSVVGYPSVPNTLNIAKWNGSSWSAVGEGVMGYVYAIAVSGSDVYVGGRFDSVVGYPSTPDTYNIARWNTTSKTWSALGQGVAGYVYAIAVSGSEVYVGGLFPGVVGYPSAPDTINIAMWNRATGEWSSLDKGVAGYVYDIAISGDYVYLGGLFSGVNVYPAVDDTINIARWNRSTKEWSALGKGVAGYIYAIAVSGDEVMGGLFSGPMCPSVPGTFNIARWSA
jgi:hypothetical protein